MSRARRLHACRAVTLLACVAGLGACRPNPRSEIAAIATAGLSEVRRTAPGEPLCVERTIEPWRPAAEARRHDPPAPPGFAALYGSGVFRGGGGVKGATVSGVPIGGRSGCMTLHGPLIEDDRAMLEVDVPPASQNLWLRRVDGDWRVVMTTASGCFD